MSTTVGELYSLEEADEPEEIGFGPDGFGVPKGPVTVAEPGVGPLPIEPIEAVVPRGPGHGPRSDAGSSVSEHDSLSGRGELYRRFTVTQMDADWMNAPSSSGDYGSEVHSMAEADIPGASASASAGASPKPPPTAPKSPPKLPPRVERRLSRIRADSLRQSAELPAPHAEPHKKTHHHHHHPHHHHHHKQPRAATDPKLAGPNDDVLHGWVALRTAVSDEWRERYLVLDPLVGLQHFDTNPFALGDDERRRLLGEWVFGSGTGPTDLHVLRAPRHGHRGRGLARAYPFHFCFRVQLRAAAGQRATADRGEEVLVAALDQETRTAWVAALKNAQCIHHYLAVCATCKVSPMQELLAQYEGGKYTAVVLRDRLLTLPAACALAVHLKAHAMLRSLTLENLGLQDDHCTVLTEAVAACHGLVALRVPSNRITDAGCGALLSSVFAAASISELDFSGNQLGDASAVRVAHLLHDQALPTQRRGWERAQLTVLRLAHNNIGKAGCKALCAAIADAQPPAPLRELDLSHNPIGDLGAASVASVLQRADHLATLRLAFCGIGDLGLQALLPGLEAARALITLELRGHAGNEHTLQRVLNIVALHQYLHSADIGHAAVFHPAVVLPLRAAMRDHGYGVQRLVLRRKVPACRLPPATVQLRVHAGYKRLDLVAALAMLAQVSPERVTVAAEETFGITLEIAEGVPLAESSRVTVSARGAVAALEALAQRGDWHLQHLGVRAVNREPVPPAPLVDAKPVEASSSHAPRWPSSLTAHWVAGRPAQLAAQATKEERETMLEQLAQGDDAADVEAALGAWDVTDPDLAAADAAAADSGLPLELTPDAIRALLPSGGSGRTKIAQRRRSRRTSSAFLVHAASLRTRAAEMPTLDEATGSLPELPSIMEEEDDDDDGREGGEGEAPPAEEEEEDQPDLTPMPHQELLAGLESHLEAVRAGDTRRGHMLEAFTAEARRREFREHAVEEAADLLSLRDELLRGEDVKRRARLAAEVVRSGEVTAEDALEMGPLLQAVDEAGLGMELGEEVDLVQRYLFGLAGRHDDEERLTQAIDDRNAARISAVLEQDLAHVDKELIDEAYRVLKIVLREEAEEELAQAMERGADPADVMELFQEAEEVGVDSPIMDEARQALRSAQTNEVVAELARAIKALDRPRINRAYVKAKQLRIKDPVVDEAYRLRYECSDDDIAIMRLRNALARFDHAEFDAAAADAKSTNFKPENRAQLLSLHIQRAAQQIVVQPGKAAVKELLSAYSNGRSRALDNDVTALARCVVSDSGPRLRSRSRAPSMLQPVAPEDVDLASKEAEEEEGDPEFAEDDERRGRRSVLVNAAATFRTEAEAGDAMETYFLRQAAGAELFGLQNCTMLRPQSDHERGRKLWGKKHKSEIKYLAFTHKLWNSLVAGLKSDQVKLALGLFQRLLVVMGDSRVRQASKDDVVANCMMLVDTGCETPALRDELYAQLCKQLTENYSAPSRLRGYYLMCLYLRCFPPSGRFRPYLTTFLHGAQKNEEHDEMATSAVQHRQLVHAVSFAVGMLSRGAMADKDIGAPSLDLIRCLIFQEHRHIPVTFMSGETIDIPAQLVGTASARDLLHNVERTLDPDAIDARFMGGALDGYRFFLLDEGEVPSCQPAMHKAVDWDEDLVWASTEWEEEGCVLLLRHMAALRSEPVEPLDGVLTGQAIPADWSRIEGLYVEERRNVQTDKYIGSPGATAYLAALAIVIELPDSDPEDPDDPPAAVPAGQELADAAHDAEIFPPWMLEGDAGAQAWDLLQGVVAQLRAKLSVLGVAPASEGVRHYLRAAFLAYLRAWPLFGVHTFPAYMYAPQGMGPDQDVFLAISGDGVRGLHDQSGVVQALFHIRLCEVTKIETREEDLTVTLSARGVELAFQLEQLDDVHDVKATLARFCVHLLAKTEFSGGNMPDDEDPADQLAAFRTTFRDLAAPPPPPALPRADEEWRLRLPPPVEREAPAVPEEDEEDDDEEQDNEHHLKYGRKEPEEEEDVVGELPSMVDVEARKRNKRASRRSIMLQDAQAAVVRAKATDAPMVVEAAPEPAPAKPAPAAGSDSDSDDDGDGRRRRVPLMVQRFPSAVFGVSRRKTALKFKVPPPPPTAHQRFGMPGTTTAARRQSVLPPRGDGDGEEGGARDRPPSPPALVSDVETPALVFRPLLVKPKMSLKQVANMQIKLNRMYNAALGSDDDSDSSYYEENEGYEDGYDGYDDEFYEEGEGGVYEVASPAVRRSSLIMGPAAMGVGADGRRGSALVPAEDLQLQLDPHRPPPKGAVRVTDLKPSQRAHLDLLDAARPPSGLPPAHAPAPAPGPPMGTPPASSLLSGPVVGGVGGVEEEEGGVSFDARHRRPSLQVRAEQPKQAFEAAFEQPSGRSRAESVAQQRAAAARGVRRRSRLL